jgi:hypothetical protein
VFVAAHITAVLVLAIPDARGVASSRSAWKDPTVQDEIAAWAERLSMDASTFETTAYDAAQTWTAAVGRLRAPVQFYSDYFGVYQTWRMFVAPHRHPAKLHIDIEEDGQWRPIQVARSDEHDWRGEQFDHVRFRAVLFRYGWSRYTRDYRALARWIARRAAEDFPSATRVRIQMYGYRTPTPQEVRDDAIPEGEFGQTLVVPLARLR